MTLGLEQSSGTAGNSITVTPKTTVLISSHRFSECQWTTELLLSKPCRDSKCPDLLKSHLVRNDWVRNEILRKFVHLLISQDQWKSKITMWPAPNLKSALTDRDRPSAIPPAPPHNRPSAILPAPPHTPPQFVASGFSPCQALCGDENTKNWGWRSIPFVFWKGNPTCSEGSHGLLSMDGTSYRSTLRHSPKPDLPSEANAEDSQQLTRQKNNPGSCWSNNAKFVIKFMKRSMSSWGLHPDLLSWTLRQLSPDSHGGTLSLCVPFSVSPST